MKTVVAEAGDSRAEHVQEDRGAVSEPFTGGAPCRLCGVVETEARLEREREQEGEQRSVIRRLRGGSKCRLHSQETVVKAGEVSWRAHRLGVWVRVCAQHMCF